MAGKPSSVRELDQGPGADPATARRRAVAGRTQAGREEQAQACLRGCRRRRDRVISISSREPQLTGESQSRYGLPYTEAIYMFTRAAVHWRGYAAVGLDERPGHSPGCRGAGCSCFARIWCGAAPPMDDYPGTERADAFRVTGQILGIEPPE